MSNQATLRHSPLLIGTALFAFLWTVARAAVQSITIDEADTYLYLVSRTGPWHWHPVANNHVLNSILMRFVTTLLPASAVTLRIPALLGSALYIAAAYFLVRLLSQRIWIAWALLVSLTCSPFIMDYLVAARGYSLASAFLLWMVTLAAWHRSKDPKMRATTLVRTCAWISVCGALSIAGNFAFAIAVVFTGLGLFLWIAREHRTEYLKIVAACLLPGLAVGYFLVGSIVLSWPRSEFTWGTDSLFEMVRSLVKASLFRPNEYLLNPRLHHYFVHFGTWFYPALAACVLCRAVMLAVERRPAPLAMICGLAMALAIAGHEFLHLAFHILLPLDRTAMWLVLLFFITAGALAAVPLTSRVGRISGNALSVVLVLIACYNIGCLRLTYFNEWQYDADVKNVYATLAYYNRTFGITRISSNWRYVAALNCYRSLAGPQTIEPIPGAPSEVDTYPEGYQAYVLFYPADAEFSQRERLKLVYHDDFTQVAIGIRPEVLDRGPVPSR